MTENITDIHKDLVLKCKAGEKKAQYQIYTLYSKAMFNVCYRIMNSHEEAEDMLQESFCDAFQKLPTFRFESTFGAWLKRITINNCINTIKKKKADIIFTDTYENCKLAQNSHDDNTIEQTMLTVEKVRQAMHKLSDGSRIVFSLYLLEGYDHTEIAEILNVSESTSKSQLMRAKKKIRDIILKENDKTDNTRSIKSSTRI